MSWDLSIDSPSGALGTSAEVRRRIDESLPGVEWSDDDNGVQEHDGCVLELSLLGGEELGDPDPNAEADTVASLMVSVRGTGDPLTPLVRLCRTNGWSLADTGSGEEIDLLHPSDQGWRDFQQFRDRAASAAGAGRSPGFFTRLFGRRG